MENPSQSPTARALGDIIGGALLIAIAALALYMVQHLPATGRVGFASGTAPRIFAYALGLLGAFIMVSGFFQQGVRLSGFNWRGIITILGSVLLFAFSIRTLGLFLSGVPMMLLATAAAPGYRYKEAIAFALAITAFCALLFPYALGQPIPLWPSL
ncbi:MAG: tripartite tricarboxylate transporter TctB family protein [Proteobacteria bacterium]|nr:tripartite tricarboxylate transporter TctB family protein [Pseudomonadota bacterium]